MTSETASEQPQESNPRKSGGPWTLVTGGRGFIGTHMVAHLVQAGNPVISIDVAPVSTSSQTASHIEIRCDIRDGEAMRQVFSDYDVGTVLDLASFTEVDLDAAAYRRNVEQTEAMTTYMAERPACQYLFYSTQFVHRVPGKAPSDETDYHPVEAYGESKILSEKLIHKRLPAGQFLILRPTYVWGPGLARFRDGLLMNLRKGRMLVPSDPSLRRSYGYVKNVAAQTAEFSQLDFATLPHKVYYLTDEPVPLAAFCDNLIAAMGKGSYHKVPGWLIRWLGAIGGIAKSLDLPAPINPTQARELVTDFPVPWERTAELTMARTDYERASRDTVAWAEAGT